MLAVDRVRFFGERVAAVAADDEDIAQQALDLIEVEYEELPAVFDVFEAMEAGAPLLHPDFPSYPGGQPFDGEPTNAYSVAVNDRGDVDAGFAEADLIVENTYTLARQHQAYLEPHSVMVDATGDTRAGVDLQQGAVRHDAGAGICAGDAGGAGGVQPQLYRRRLRRQGDAGDAADLLLPLEGGRAAGAHRQ